MKLIRYGQFINESVEITDEVINILLERGKFWNELMELDYYKVHSKFDFTSNYSDMCKKDGRNPEMDFLKIQKHFDQIGFTLEKLGELFSEESNKKCGYDLNDLYKGGSYPINREPFKSIIFEVKKKFVLYGGYSKEYDTIITPLLTMLGLPSSQTKLSIPDSNILVALLLMLSVLFFATRKK